SAKKDTFIVDLLRKAREVLPGEKHYYLTSLEILPHKIWGVDCSKGKRGEYVFELYDMGMLDRLSAIQVNQERSGLTRISHHISTTTANSASSASSDSVGHAQHTVKYASHGLGRLPRIQGGLGGLATKSDEKCGLEDSYVYEREGKLISVESMSDISQNEEFSFGVSQGELPVLGKKDLDIVLEGYEKDFIKIVMGLSFGEKEEVLEKNFRVIPLSGQRGAVNINLEGGLEGELHWLELMAPDQEWSSWRYQIKAYRLSQYKREWADWSCEKDPMNFLFLDEDPLEISSKEVDRIGDGCFEFRLDRLQMKEGDHLFKFVENEKLNLDWFMINPKIEEEEAELPSLEFKKINPTRYAVDVKGAKAPFVLVFNESYHRQWRAYVREVKKSEISPAIYKDEPFKESRSALWNFWKDRGRRVKVKDHFVVNGYANGWWVDPSKVSQNQSFRIILEFQPQRFFEVGMIISGISLFGCWVYCCFCWMRRRQPSYRSVH
ncbi:MAG: hypothetical protein HYZ67_07450, partial [Chlamydiae bacterium]|nr:hypothetical protein [Chlamydiota bacterium]